MRKFKVVKKWPGGPEVGETLIQSESNAYPKYAYQQDGRGNGWAVNQLEGFVEEVIIPDDFWWVNFYNRCEIEKGNVLTSPCVAPEARFRTKESAEKFAKALKDTHGRKISLSMQEGDGQYGIFPMVNIHAALNDRVTK